MQADCIRIINAGKRVTWIAVARHGKDREGETLQKRRYLFNRAKLGQVTCNKEAIGFGLKKLVD